MGQYPTSTPADDCSGCDRGLATMPTDVSLPLQSGLEISGVLALPSSPGPHPVVIVIHEAFDIDDSMRAHVDRLARAGYLAIMPNLFSRGGARKCLLATFRALMSGRGVAFDDIEATKQWALARSDTTDKVGVIGFCMGGGFALMLAGRGYDAASVNYGQVPRDAEQILTNACPIVGSFGGEDRTMKGMGARLEKVLVKLQVPHDVKEYPHTGHGFLNEFPAGPAWSRMVLKRVMGVTTNPEAAPDAWNRITTFFDTYLDSSNPRGKK